MKIIKIESYDPIHAYPDFHVDEKNIRIYNFCFELKIGGLVKCDFFQIGEFVSSRWKSGSNDEVALMKLRFYYFHGFQPKNNYCVNICHTVYVTQVRCQCHMLAERKFSWKTTPCITWISLTRISLTRISHSPMWLKTWMSLTANIFKSGPMPTPWNFLEGDWEFDFLLT